MKKLANEIKTIIMVVVSISVLGFIIYKIGGLKFGEKGYTAIARFNYAAGIELNAPVHLGGVEVGEVREINIQYGDEPKILLKLWFKPEAKLRRDSKAYINTMGLIGEKYVELTFGSLDSPILKPGEIVEGEDPFQMDKLMKKSEAIAENLNNAINDMRSLAKNIDSVVTDNKAGINRIVANLEATAKNFEEFSDDIKRHPWKLLMKGKEEKPKVEKKR